jgi:hypothetical protein
MRARDVHPTSVSEYIRKGAIAPKGFDPRSGNVNTTGKGVGFRSTPNRRPGSVS